MNEPARRRGAGLCRGDATLTALLAPLLAALLAGCGGSPAPSQSPTPPPPSPSPTPDPRLADPARADAVYTALGRDGLTIVGTNAVAGADPVMRINATYAGAPLAIVAYTSTARRQHLFPMRNDAAPGPGDPPYTFAGLNLVVLFGPSSVGSKPPSGTALAGPAASLAAELDRLAGPLIERSTVRVAPTPKPTPARGLTPSATP